MKKAVAVAAAALLAATAAGTLAACGEDKEHTIEVFLLANNHESLFYTDYFEGLEETLAEEGLNYKIKFNGEQEENYYTSLKADINRGATPDIFYLRPNELLQYKDKIASLESYAKTQKEVDLSDIYETALNMYRFDPATGRLGNEADELYAFPKDLSTQQLGYNRTLLSQFEQKIEDAGYAMPWDIPEGKTYTLEEYKGICKVIADNAQGMQYACDVPSIEVLTYAYGGKLIDLDGGRANGKVSPANEGPLYNAIKYQAELVDCGAANYMNATYQNFGAGRVCFYGLVGSWEIADYDSLLGEGNWGVMPWPTQDGGPSWTGLITSAGYVVSKECAESEKGEVAKRIAISFMSSYAQNRLVKEEKISLPLHKSVEDDFRNPANDSVYSPATRGVFLDVVSGDHGVVPAKYLTYDAVWLKELDDALTLVWNEGKGKALTKFNETDWTQVTQRMQQQYDSTKNN